jgi:serine/threonine-protein kinase
LKDRTWRRLEELFERVQAMPLESRARFLDEACADDVALRTEVEALVAAGQEERALAIERLVIDEPSPGPEEDPWLGQCLGPWRLARVVGRGGMGLVYGAERADGQYQLEVAVKLMRAGPRDPYATERFRTERQVLASLKHPNIAGLLDGGFAPDGTPYLVMELVDGAPITDWCRSRLLSLEGRLDLFRVVCDAVQHAHGVLVVHRDLKPTNILVTKAGDVKLLDFGIAKLLDPEAWGMDASQTRTEMRVLTPAYSAPEQRHGGAITTATDVYALGVLLYELVAGVRPLARGAPHDAPAREAVPTVVMPPSEAIRRNARAQEDRPVDLESSGAEATVPVPDAPRLARRIRGDLDRIVLKALNEEPDHRYVSAGQLGEEIGRFLAGRAVLAQPDTLRYRVRRFVGRNRAAVVASAVLVLSLAAFGVVSAWQARVLAEQRRVAQLERDTAEQVVRVLIDLFETTNPSVRPDGDRMPIGEFLEGAQARSLGLLQGAPSVRAKLQNVFGHIHLTRGQYDAARRTLEEALAQQRELLGADHAETLETLQTLGEVLHEGGDDARARALLDESLERHRRAYGDNDARTARVLHALAPVVAERDLDEAGVLLHRSLAIRRATLAANHPDIAKSLQSLGGYHYRRGEYERAREFYLQALDVFPAPEDRRNPLAISILADLANVLSEVSDLAEAERVQREAIDLAREVLGSESLIVANLLNNLGTTEAIVGKHAEAEQSFRAAFETHLSLVGENHWRTRNVSRNVGRTLFLQRRYAEALPWMDRALPTPAEEAAGGRPQTFVRAQRALVLFRLGRRAEAVAETKYALQMLERVNTPEAAPPLAGTRVLLGRMLVEMDRPGEALAPLEAAADWTGHLGPGNPQHAEATCELARARILRGGRDEDWQRLQQCLPVLRTWGLADPEAVAGLERLAASPSPR